MSFNHALATNNYGPAKLIVSTSAAHGTHTTLASAIAAASVGDTIFLRDSVTENVTLTAGVNIAAWQGGTLNTPSITGTVTMTGTGTSNISGIELITNSAAAIAVTGSAASVLNFFNCYLNFSNNTGINFTSSSSSAAINFVNCQGNLGTTGIGLYSMSSAGNLSFAFTNFTNTGGSSTASAGSAGQVGFNYCGIFSPLSCSGGLIVMNGGFVNTIAQNVTCITTSGTGQAALHNGCSFASGSASSLSIGSGTIINVYQAIEVNSSNTNAITGAGTIGYGFIIYSGSSSTNNVTTQTAFTTQPAIPAPSTSVVVQQIRATNSSTGSFSTSLANTTTLPSVSVGGQCVSASITPTNASHVLVIEGSIALMSNGCNDACLYLIKNNTGNATFVQPIRFYGTETGGPWFFQVYFSAGSTSSAQYAIWGAGVSAGVFLNSANGSTAYTGCVSTMTITEYTS